MTNILSTMLKLFQKLTFFGVVILFCLNVLLFPSCKKYSHNAQIRRIDTLINWNNNAKGMLIIDAQAIKLRVDSMKIKLSMFDSITINSSGDQFKSDLIQYKGLMLRYIDFMDNYAVLEFDNSINSRMLDDLKKKIVDHITNNKTLDTMLNSKERIIHSHLMQTQDVVKTLFSIEEMYQRLNNRVNEIYENKIYVRKSK
jgi:hypothetical protein